MKTSALKPLMTQAVQLHQSGNLNQAKKLYQQVLTKHPKHPDALHLFGLACHQLGDHATAVQFIQQAVILAPAQPVLRNNLGNALHKAGNTQDAIKQLQQALQLNPNYAGAHQNLSAALFAEDKLDEALKHAKLAVTLNPKSPESLFDLGLIQLEHILLEDAANTFRQALQLRPTYTKAATNLLYILNLLTHTDASAIADEHQSVVAALYPSTPANDSPWHKPHQPIRVAYVSRDFCAHAVNYFFEPILNLHDTKQFEITCYSDVAKPDAVTKRLKQHPQHWFDTNLWSDDKLYKHILSRQIDVLIDLGGHTENNRLAVFARKPAPCQISYLGFPNTTGLSAMDYRIVDKFTAPDSKPALGTEKLLRLPHIFACYRPTNTAKNLSPAPNLKNGYTTFGSLHKLEKINDQVIALWAELLRDNPNTKLLLARDQLNQWHCDRLTALFKHHGITPERLELRELSDPTKSFFELFADMDILLDTFPWSGHTLACCALWMGVPVVTLAGETHASRMVASVLQQLGQDELIASSPAQYLEIASKLCQDQNRLGHYRETLRSQFERSSLRDEKAFTEAFEAAIIEACKN